MTIAIREYRLTDFDELLRLDQECFTPDLAYSRLELMHYMRRPLAFTLVAADKNAIAGFVVAECSSVRPRVEPERRRQVGHIITLDVLQTARRSGVGSCLMQEAESRLHARGCDIVYLETAVNNLAAIAFYKRRGYTVLKTLPRYYHGELDALLMGKKLVVSSS